MKGTKQIFFVALLAILFSACKNIDFKKTKEGFIYKIFSDEKGAKIVGGNIAKINYINKVGDSVIRTSYGVAPEFVPIPKDQNGENYITRILKEARKGDSIIVNLPVDTIAKENPAIKNDSLFKHAEYLTTYIRVVDILKNEEEQSVEMEKVGLERFHNDPQAMAQLKKDEGIIEPYLKAHNIQTQRTTWGVYVQTLDPGNGPKAKVGQFVSVRYTGKDLDGKVFDSNNKPGAEPLVVQVGAGGAIFGFQEGLRQLGKGGKGVIYIPSILGYGPQGNPPVIQPNQNLVFEITVDDISDTKPNPPTPTKVDTTKRR